MMQRAAELERSGTKVIHLEVGQADFDTPDFVKRAAIDALSRGETSYSHNRGTAPLRVAISRRVRERFGVSVEPDSEVLVTHGATEGLTIAMGATLNPGDEILVPALSWANYLSTPPMFGALPVAYPLRADEGFNVDVDGLARLVTSRTKAILLNSPHNPTGGRIDGRTLAAICRLCGEHNLFLIADEVYSEITYDSEAHVSVLSELEVRDRTILVDAFSKTYSMTGWRLGFVVASPPVTLAMAGIRQNTTGTLCTFNQQAGVAALEGDHQVVVSMVEQFGQRRALVVDRLQQLPGVSFFSPKGAFYVFPNIASYGLSSEDFASRLLDEFGVAVVPGTVFGPSGEGYVRLSFAASLEDVTTGMGRLEAFLKSLT